MMVYLDELRGFNKQLSPEIGITDPISGDMVFYGAQNL
tara:strand:+ start:254 stop:367 length:114 start_codon:yes stop_codon:yes gene_type:complete